MSEYLDKAFSPAVLGKSLEVRNRIIKAATFEGKTPGGMPGQALHDFHRELCDGGVGMTTIGYCTTEADGRISEEMMYLGDYARPQLTSMIADLKTTGTKVSGQMTHCGNFSKNRQLQRLKRAQGPSPQFNDLGLIVGKPWADGMTEADIDYLVDTYYNAALYMKEVGFDATEIHFSHGYGLSQFISPKTNKRSDKYGGSIENRMRLPLRILEAVRKAVGDDFPIMGKMGLTDGDAVKNGLTEDEAIRVAEMLDQGGIDALITSGGTSTHNTMWMFRGEPITKAMIATQTSPLMKMLFTMVGPMKWKNYPYEELFFLDGFKRVRDAVKNSQMIYIGGCHEMDSLEKVISEGADFVQIGRALIRNPNYVNDAMAQREQFHSGCTHCNRCVATIEAPGGVHCYLREEEKAIQIQQA
jgi:2,4-dienoyl-CoA reductase-like NADH-dependent reductase (Old Yellow Enzyme family)